MVKRYEQLAAWTAGDIVTPMSVWLPGLFNPKAFLTAIMQTYARANKLPLDVMKVRSKEPWEGWGMKYGRLGLRASSGQKELLVLPGLGSCVPSKAALTRPSPTPSPPTQFMTDVTKLNGPEDVKEPAPLGVYIHGLFIEGARWDKKDECLRESHPNELHPAMPVIQVRPVTSEQYVSDGYYQCPVYTNMQRANVYSPIVSMFTLRTADPEHRWTLASVALLLQDELSV